MNYFIARCYWSKKLITFNKKFGEFFTWKSECMVNSSFPFIGLSNNVIRLKYTENKIMVIIRTPKNKKKNLILNWNFMFSGTIDLSGTTLNVKKIGMLCWHVWIHSSKQIKRLRRFNTCRPLAQYVFDTKI